ncbi:MAG: DUF917 domain-containing protein [Acidobacteria bacterium]|nr:DUF917 domain-containing protein [Acidobacteriota bacterium]
MTRQSAAMMMAIVCAIATAMCAPSSPSSVVPSAPKVRILTEQEVIDTLVGSSIQSTRNSNTEGMIRQAKALLAQGKQFTMVSADDLPDDWHVVAAAGGVGGGGAWEHVVERTKSQNLPTVDNTTVASAEALAKHLGVKWNAVIRNEAAGAMMGAFNSAIALGIPVVDACLAGRAKPELNLQVSFINGVSGSPAALVTRWGDTIILDKTVDDYRLEDLARAVAVSSGGGSSIARNPMSGAEVKRGTIRGAVSEAMLFGRTVREAREQGQDPVDALIRVANGFKLFQGVVKVAAPRGERGFNWEDAELEGVGPYKGHTYKIFVKNENIISWLDGKPDVLPPDLIYTLDPKTGDAITSPRMGGYPLGMEVVIVGRAASPMWRTPAGIELFGPRHFGFDLDFVPIEETLKSRPRFGAN